MVSVDPFQHSELDLHKKQARMTQGQGRSTLISDFGKKRYRRLLDTAGLLKQAHQQHSENQLAPAYELAAQGQLPPAILRTFRQLGL
jgi:hypothetical protein